MTDHEYPTVTELEYPTTYGFWSYARQDNQISDGKLNLLRLRIQAKLQGLVGTSPVDIWQDTSNLQYGDVWHEQITFNINRSSFFIPIITPSFLQSKYCCEETNQFLKREASLKRTDLIFPIFYLETGHLSIDNPRDCRDRSMWTMLKKRDGLDFRIWVDSELTSELVLREITKFASDINSKLRRDTVIPSKALDNPAAIAPQGTPGRGDPHIYLDVDLAASTTPNLNTEINDDGDRQLESIVDPKSLLNGGGLLERVGFENPSIFNIAARFEIFAKKIHSLNVFTVSLIMGLSLISLAGYLGIIDIYNSDGKQVGFLYAPNWSIMYTVLFPTYNALFCSMVTNVRQAFENLIKEGVITSVNEKNINLVKIWNSWTEHLNSVSLSFWVLIIFVIIISSLQYKSEIYNVVNNANPINARFGRSIDWGIYTIERPDIISSSSQLAFSAIAYLYMAMALWVFLAILLYVPTFAWYLRKLSSGEGSFGIVLQGSVFQKTIESMIRRTFTCTFLGLLASYFMRLQSSYRNSSELTIWSYVASGDQDWIEQLLHGSSTRAPGHSFALWSSWTSLSVALVAVGSFVISVAFMREAFDSSRSYLMSHIRREDWRRRVGLQEDAVELARLHQTSFRAEIMPYYSIYVIIMGLILISIAIPNHVVFVISSTVIFCLFMIFTRKTLSKS